MASNVADLLITTYVYPYSLPLYPKLTLSRTCSEYHLLKVFYTYLPRIKKLDRRTCYDRVNPLRVDQQT